MANPTMDILEVARKRLGDDANVDFLRDTVAAVLAVLMEAEVSNQTGAAHGERSPDRQSDEWAIARRYFSEESMKPLFASPSAPAQSPSEAPITSSLTVAS